MALKLEVTGVEELAQHQMLHEVKITRSLYAHSRARVTLRSQEHVRQDGQTTATVAAKALQCPMDVFWKDNDLSGNIPCFHGYVEQAYGQRNASYSLLTLEGVSYTQQTDLVRRTRAYQATTLLNIAEQIASHDPRFQIVDASRLSQAIPLSLQYAETDFTYLRRMLGAWGVPMATRDLTGNVLLGAQGKPAEGEFPDAGSHWKQVAFHGLLMALPTLAGGGGGGPVGIARQQLSQFVGELPKIAANYHQTPESPHISENVSANASQSAASGYHLYLESMILPFSPGDIVPFEGQQHLIREVNITWSAEQPAVRQEFVLQPVTEPLAPEHHAPQWSSRAVLGNVTDNEHDPLQQGRVQVEFEWEHLDPQSSQDRAWLHTLTPYGGGHAGGKKSSAYSGLYALPEVGERVMVEFLGNWDSEAVIMGVVRHNSQKVPFNAKDTKRFSTPSGNELTMHTKDGTDVVRVMNRNALALESQFGADHNSVTLNCGGHPENIMHFETRGGQCRLDISSNNIVYIQSAAEIHIKSQSIVIEAKGGLHLKGKTVQISSDDAMVIDAGANLHLQGKTAQLQATGGSVKADGSDKVLLNTTGPVGLPQMPAPPPD